MDEQKRNELKSESLDAAISLLEDFEHLKMLSTQAETQPLDLRRSSAILRRWLVEDMLRQVANPRLIIKWQTKETSVRIYK
jgi:hypothetical protein